MSPAIPPPVPRSSFRLWTLWLGRLISIAPVLIVLMSARWKLTHDPWYVREWARIGWTESALPYIAMLQLVAITLYVIPQTAMLGAILLTGYMGGAIASYVRLGELNPPLVPFTAATLAWIGLYLREERLWRLVPFRWRSPATGATGVGS